MKTDAFRANLSTLGQPYIVLSYSSIFANFKAKIWNKDPYFSYKAAKIIKTGIDV